MNRRTFSAGIFAAAAVMALPRVAAAQTTGKCIFVTQEYGEEEYLTTITHSVVWFDSEDVANKIFINELANALESDEDFFLREAVEDAPTFGDDSVSVIGKHDADAFWFQVTMRTGVVIQKFTFEGEDKDALIADSTAMIEVALARQEYKKEYADADLFALLLTEEETGLPVVSQEYAVETYNIDNLGG